MLKLLLQSLLPGSGATTVAFNLAQALSTQQPGTLVSLRPEHGQILASCQHSIFTSALTAITDNLPATYFVSENDGALVLRFQNTDFLRLKGHTLTIYPQ